MDVLFSATLILNNDPASYRVIFENEQYVFLSEAGNQSFPRFAFRREHDEWESQDQLPDELKQQAVDALERYLLKQH